MSASATLVTTASSSSIVNSSRHARDRFEIEGRRILRHASLPNGRTHLTEIPNLADRTLTPHSAFEQSVLRASRKPWSSDLKALKACDLFSGIGGLSAGAELAGWRAGIGIDFVFAADNDARLIEKYTHNFRPRHVTTSDLESIVDGALYAKPTESEKRLLCELGAIDVVLAGPPCQGHSDLNNHTRRSDPRNQLYLRTVRFIEITAPDFFLIENVPGVVHDSSGIVRQAVDHLLELGYEISSSVLNASALGVAQNRKRFFLIGSRRGTVDLQERLASVSVSPRSVLWAIDDLAETEGSPFTSAAKHWPVNESRINYLFEHGLYDLPNSERPPCHRNGGHSYKSVYGRMFPDKPAPTLTVGFGSTGQGRFVHPREPRTLTPNEAARVQSFPDWFDFSGMKRGELQKAIGNAVPPLMASVALSELLDQTFS